MAHSAKDQADLKLLIVMQVLRQYYVENIMKSEGEGPPLTEGEAEQVATADACRRNPVRLGWLVARVLVVLAEPTLVPGCLVVANVAGDAGTYLPKSHLAGADQARLRSSAQAGTGAYSPRTEERKGS
eukprot:scaffold1042_cov401-Prasinococcus_capsulatus_cf.AAC.48